MRGDASDRWHPEVSDADCSPRPRGPSTVETADDCHFYSTPGGSCVFRRDTRPDGMALLAASGEFGKTRVDCLRQALTDALGTVPPGSAST
ncbi:hypothetical protein ACFV2S_30250 [Streptomyces sp. NPDC059695]|uniref:hypothetical protein n=1 Tax=Streptomyces sp. NPDC059695 TaxID=3346910 RepID=UPI0036878D94